MKETIQSDNANRHSDRKTGGRKDTFSLTNLLKSNLWICILSGILLVLMEWLFLITKPSFLNASTFIEKFTVLMSASLILVALLVLFSIPALIICSIFPKQIKLFAHLLAIAPSAMLASLALLLIDNFTYTLFKYGIVDSGMTMRAVYLAIWILIFILSNHSLAERVIRQTGKQSGNKFAGLLPTLATLAAIIISFMIIRVPSGEGDELSSLITAKNYPNIVLFTADGVNAKSMSIYGYNRETTPFLDSIKDDLIISANHFNNGANTTGSIISILTGKHPTVTRVLFPPDVLRGKDSLEHLPAILRDLGYYSAQITISHYIDAPNQNLQGGFNETNGVSLKSSSFTNYLTTRVPGNTILFVREVESRLLSRLKHILMIETMQNTFEQITQTQQDFNDLDKIHKAMELINQKDQPVFVQIHWMGTHGDKFYPESRKFSAGIDVNQQGSWNTNFYDDAIVDVDSGLEVLFRELEASGELDSTLIIISSDHGRDASTIQRLPMILHLPTDSGQVIKAQNTQHIDIAPTVLDILGQPQLSWMEAGTSMFAEDYPDGLVISTGTKRAEDKSGKSQWTLKEEYFTPPFYQFDYINVIDCDQFYRLNLEKFTWENGVISTYVGTCSEQDYASKTDIRLVMINRLLEDGFEFDPGSIPEMP